MNELCLPVTVGGVTFKNPFFVASGPTTKSVEQLVRIEQTGWAAASIKLSIDPAPYINRKPRYSIFKAQNALAFTAEKRLTFAEGLQLIREAKPKLHDLKLMANITYAGDDGVSGWVNMAKRFEAVGADIIELNMCCPNMSYNTDITSGGKEMSSRQTGASMGQHAEISAEIVRAIKKEITIPLFVKLTPEGGQIAKVAKALYEAGADCVGGTGNRLGMPPIDLDNPGSSAFHLQDELSLGCYCSGWLKPLAERDVYEMRRVCGMEVPIHAAGGIRNGTDAIEMILCGGTLLGVCAETLISGYDIVRPMIKAVKDYMDAHGYVSLEQMRGLIVPTVKTAPELTLWDGYAKIVAPNLSAPCKSACPHHVPTQAYVQKIAKRDFRAAYDLITEKNMLQGICALACDHPCEDVCIRSSFDAPVRIKALKKFVLDYGQVQGWTPRRKSAAGSGHKVAIVGSGLTGLACAAELQNAGYSVTVFEKESQPGGALRYAMPSVDGLNEALDREIKNLSDLGVEFLCGTEVGRDISVEDIRKRGFEQIIAATGKQSRSSDEHTDALAFLKNGGSVKGKAAVFGKGPAAAECAIKAMRSGAEQVSLFCTAGESGVRGRKELLQKAADAGVRIFYHAAFVEKDGVAVAVEINGTKMTLQADTLIFENALEENRFDGMESVLICEAKTDSVISAISAGKNAAASVDRSIRGSDAAVSPIAPCRTVSPSLVKKRTGYLARDCGPKTIVTEEDAVAEASRCLNCGCGEGCQLCRTICTDFAPEISDTDTMHIREDKCVACGMCYNRCPNGNIEMVNRGVRV